jgi:hypothetical protein
MAVYDPLVADRVFTRAFKKSALESPSMITPSTVRPYRALVRTTAGDMAMWKEMWREHIEEVPWSGLIL